jgi:PST family polysaccharide transporter
VQVVLSTSGSFFQAMNRADLLFLSGFLSTIVMVSAIVWGVYQRDMIALSWALVAAFHINFIQAYYIMYSRVFGKNVFSFLVRMTPIGLASFGMVLWH